MKRLVLEVSEDEYLQLCFKAMKEKKSFKDILLEPIRDENKFTPDGENYYVRSSYAYYCNARTAN